MDLLARDPLAQDHLVRAPPLCCVVVCRCGVCSRFSWVRPRFGRSPRLPLSRTPLRRTTQNSAFFFPLSPPFSLVLSSLSWGGLLVEFWWCLKRRDPQMCTFGLSGCRVKPRRLLPNVKNNFTIFAPQKKSLEHTEIPREDAPPPSGPTPLGPHFFWVVVCAVCACLLLLFLLLAHHCQVS